MNGFSIVSAGDHCVDAIQKGGKLLICGNGGSAAMASHFAAELVGRFECDGHPIACLNLAADLSVMTAIANDYGYGQVFSRQVTAFGRPEDILILLTTSGKSKNVEAAMEAAHARQMGVVYPELKRPGESVSFCQERHLTWLHGLAGYIEKACR